MKNRRYFLCVLAVFTLIFAVGCSKKHVAVKDYVKVVGEGYDGYATVTVSLDKDALAAALADKKILSKSDAKKFVESVELTVKDNGHISKKGAVISMKADESYIKKNRIDISECSIKPEGIKDGITVDAFSELTVKLEGIIPKVHLVLENASENEYVSKLTYKYDSEAMFKAGDEVEVFVEVNEEEEGRKGYTFKQISQKYVIGDISAYPEGTAELDKAVIDKTASLCKDVISDDTADTTKHMMWRITDNPEYLLSSSVETASAIELIGIYFLQEKNIKYGRDNNYLYYAYSADISNGSSGMKGYFVFELKNVYISATGELVVPTNNLKEKYFCGESFEELYGLYIEEKFSEYLVSKVSGK